AFSTLLILFHFLKCFHSPHAGVGLLTSLGHRPDHYMCYKNGGTCLHSSCPIYTKVIGTCYSGKAKCCK
uniref:Beta-defensin 1 n=1 Tax=Prolemur simus TaxID=1328070 RepID=A0A8C8YHE9_PROSS